MIDKKTIGFGVPNELDPHHFVINIPVARTDPVVITEQFGLRGGSNGMPDSILRCRLPRSAWTAIGEESKRVLNERLKEKKLPTSRWGSGPNKVERLLGRELCVLAWSVENAKQDLIPNALRNWAGLRPDERWWLFSMASAQTGSEDDSEIGWRKAIRIALTENPSGEEIAAARFKKPRRPTESDRPTLPLFDKG